MALKRKREPETADNTGHQTHKQPSATRQFASGANTQPSTGSNSEPLNHKQHKKSKKPNPFPSATSRPKKHTVGPLKRRIRDIKRQLSKLDNLPADVRIAKERELRACEWDLQHEEAEIRRREMIGKYHMVRFFERQKATKRLKSAKKALANAQSNSSNGDHPRHTHEVLEQAVRDAQVDLNYTLYYPLCEPYVSLWPKARRQTTEKETPEAEEDGEEEDDADGAAGDAADDRDDTERKAEQSGRSKGNLEMRARVEEAMQEGQAALDALRNRPLSYLGAVHPGTSVKIRPPEGMPQRSARQEKSLDGEAQGEESAEDTRVVKQSSGKIGDKVAAIVQKKAQILGAEAMNRRERRAAMRQLEEEMAREEDDSEGGFFE